MDFKDRLTVLGIALVSAALPVVTYLAMAVLKPEATGLLFFWVPFVVLPCAIAFVGFLAVAIFGSQTTFRNGYLRMGKNDQGVFIAGLVWSLAALIFSGLEPDLMEEAFAIVWGVPVGIRIGSAIIGHIVGTLQRSD